MEGSCGRGLECDIGNKDGDLSGDWSGDCWSGMDCGLCVVESTEKQITRLTDMNDQLQTKLDEKDKYMEIKMNEKEDNIANLSKLNDQLNVMLKEAQTCLSG